MAQACLNHDSSGGVCQGMQRVCITASQHSTDRQAKLAQVMVAALALGKSTEELQT